MRLPHNGDETLNIIEASAEYDVCFSRFIVIPCVGSLEYALDASLFVSLHTKICIPLSLPVTHSFTLSEHYSLS